MRPRAAPRGTCRQDLHQERWGDLFSSHTQNAPRRRNAIRTYTRRPLPWCQVLLPHPGRRPRLSDAPDLLRDTRPTRRAANRRPGLCLAGRHGARRPHRSCARDPRRPPRWPIGNTRLAAKGAGAAYVGRRIARYPRPLLDTGPGCRRFRRNSRSRRDFRSLSPGPPQVATTSPQVAFAAPRCSLSGEVAGTGRGSTGLRAARRSPQRPGDPWKHTTVGDAAPANMVGLEMRLGIRRLICRAGELSGGFPEGTEVP
jgi:hypothetical protein